MQVETEFTIQLAAEPLVSSPVALTFDKTRLWVIEMQVYMPETMGTGEDLRTARSYYLNKHS